MFQDEPQGQVTLHPIVACLEFRILSACHSIDRTEQSIAQVGRLAQSGDDVSLLWKRAHGTAVYKNIPKAWRATRTLKLKDAFNMFDTGVRGSQGRRHSFQIVTGERRVR